MNTRTLNTLVEVMQQYDVAMRRANAADKGYCWCHDIWQYGAQVEEDYKAIALAIAKANRLEKKEKEQGRTEYAQYLSDQIDLLVFEIHAIAGGPGPNNCGIEFFASS